VQRILEITGDWQKFKGLPGAEGTLKVKEPKADKRALFEAAVAAAGGEVDSDATTPKKKSTKKAADKGAEGAAKAEKAEAKADTTEKADGDA
jgi:small subunit ribosomal protein S16